MKIILLMDPFIPVPPLHYGGIERVIYDIACKYVEMGHEVTLIAGPNSKSPGRLITYSKNGNGYVKLKFTVLKELYKILKKEIPNHDVIHNFGRLAFLFPIAWTSIRKVQTYMRYITTGNIKWLNRIGCRNITYTAVSDAIVRTGITGGGEWKTVYNSTPIEQFNFVDEVPADAPLVFLGRLERCKGAHSAIAVAKLTKRKLIIAGNISHLSSEQDYFNNEIRPQIDGEWVKYVGVVDNEQKNKLLGSAAAMLLPIEWYEPFPIVLPESFACGTPILAFPNGGVPEGIREGVTGFLCNKIEDMAQQVNNIHILNRAECRKDAEEKYSDTVIAKEYLKIYNNKI
ncbi:MAG: glycosyltransferase [Sphingobacteriales bacterium]|nr:glycosyltransferase [Sphingobacteriales bacterium]